LKLSDNSQSKIPWEGIIVSIQPRIRLLRSFDQRSHSYLGYNLNILGTIAGSNREFIIGIGKSAHEKHQFRVGDVLRGLSHSVVDQRKEVAEFFKTSKLTILERSNVEQLHSPPWLGIPPDLAIYRERGHRRLDTRTYRSKCLHCIWGSQMAVEMIIDQWNPGKLKYRYETFCYGPKACSFYKAGPNRKVPGRKGMTWVEEDWIDEDATAHRAIDE
jgi:hypothetical protein